MMITALLGLGSNLGDREAYLVAARADLEAHPCIRLDCSSGLFNTAAVGGPLKQPDYLNAVLLIATSLPPTVLLAFCQELERRAGRERQIRWGARTLDVDLLCYDALVLNEPDLQLPHPRLHERRFVLEPLCDLVPDWPHPVSGETFASLLNKLPVSGVQRLRTIW